MSFPEEGKLWSEVHSLLEALQNDPGDSKNHFLTGRQILIFLISTVFPIPQGPSCSKLTTLLVNVLLIFQKFI